MALQRATYTGKTDILDGYDAIIDSIEDGCFYSVWVTTKDISFQCISADKDKARQMFETWIDSIETAENDDIFLLKFHPSNIKGFIDRKTPVICMCPIRITDIGEAKIITGKESGSPYAIYKLKDQLDGLPDMINAAIDAKLSGLNELPEVDPVEKILGYIGMAAQNPAIMDAVGQILNFIKPQIMAPRLNGVKEDLIHHGEAPEPELIPPAPVPTPEPELIPPAPINEDMLNDALDILEKHCRIDKDLMLLAKLAETNPGLFGLMLQQLRSQ